MKAVKHFSMRQNRPESLRFWLTSGETRAGWWDMNQEVVRSGQVYRSMESGLFGRPGQEWRVMSLAQRSDGMTYATLAMTHDPSEVKTLAMNVLLDRRMYGRVADAPSDVLPLAKR